MSHHDQWLQTLDGDTKDVVRRVNAVERQQAPPSGMSSTYPGPASRPKESLVDRKGCRDLLVYKGDASTCDQWRFKVENFLSTTDRAMEQLLVWATDQTLVSITTHTVNQWAVNNMVSDGELA